MIMISGWWFRTPSFFKMVKLHHQPMVVFSFQMVYTQPSTFGMMMSHMTHPFLWLQETPGDLGHLTVPKWGFHRPWWDISWRLESIGMLDEDWMNSMDIMRQFIAWWMDNLMHDLISGSEFHDEWMLQGHDFMIRLKKLVGFLRKSEPGYL